MVRKYAKRLSGGEYLTNGGVVWTNAGYGIILRRDIRIQKAFPPFFLFCSFLFNWSVPARRGGGLLPLLSRFLRWRKKDPSASPPFPCFLPSAPSRRLMFPAQSSSSSSFPSSAFRFFFFLFFGRRDPHYCRSPHQNHSLLLFFL